MTSVLVVHTSLQGQQGNSSQLANDFIAQLATQQPLNVEHLDLSSVELPHLSAAEMTAWSTPAEQRTADQQKLAALSDDFIRQIQAADVVVIGMPLYNFGTPSVFKAWVDRIARAGITFKYTEQGPTGLLNGKQAYVLAARGGIYAGTPLDTQTDFVRNVLNFVGIEQVEFIYAEGLAMGAEKQQQGFSNAKQKIVELIGKQAA